MVLYENKEEQLMTTMLLNLHNFKVISLKIQSAIQYRENELESVGEGARDANNVVCFV